ncbi:hypothetical protein GQR36_08275 [Enterococcus termitis]
MTSDFKRNSLRGLIIIIFLLVSFAAFRSKQYQIISLLLVLLACLPIYYRYEKKQMNIKELVLIAVLIAVAVSGRFLFYMIPAVTPMTAIIIISGICLGRKSVF